MASSVIGLRCQVGERVQIRRSVIMGADFYEEDAETGREPPGVGAGAVIEGALIDKNVVIGAGARLVASEAPSRDGDFGRVCMRDGIAVVRRGAQIPENWTLGDPD